MRRLTALALVLVCLTPCAGLAQETVEADFEGGHWLYEDTAQGVRVEIVRHEDTENRVLWYEADLVCGEDSPLRFLTANEDAPGRGFWYPERLAREKRAVFAINDDQFGHRVYNHDTVGVIVRGGEVLSERTRKSGSKGWPPLDTAAFFPDGSMRVFESAEHTGEEYLAMGAENVLAFGPWLVRGGEINPALDALIRECCGGDDYLLRPDAVQKLEKYRDDPSALKRLADIKAENKRAFANYVARETGIILNTDAMFDVQVKRLHEYKRQLLNVLHITYLYQRLKADPNFQFTPRVYLFGAKAAPGYAVAKQIIHLINSLSATINADPVCRDRLQVVFLENYRVSLAEKLMPASELSEQISTAGKEASGTGNMKFMMNGALTVGTLDGANVEMHDVLGDENMFLFGLHADQAATLKREGYVPQRYISHDPQMERCLNALRKGFRDGVSYEDLYQRLISQDEYLLLADYRAYCDAERRMAETYENRETWNRMSLHNIARSGIFAADRAVAEYADNIWDVPHR
mgnify:CR=1 FL=1